MKHRLISVATGAVVLAVSPLSRAAEVQGAPQIEEIVVTAQKRTERLQDVGAAITAIGDEQISRLGIRSLNDLMTNVPSLQVAEVGPGESEISLRGMVTGYGLAPTVSLYVDETPLDLRSDMRSAASLPDLFDVDRVEVLRGPQGTLYGSSSLGGAIRVINKRPDPVAFSASTEAGVYATDGGDPGYEIKGAVNIPLAQNVAVRLVGVRQDLGGFVDRVTPTDWYDPAPHDPITKRNINDYQSTSVRGTLEWRAGNGWTIRPSFSYEEGESGGRNSFETHRRPYEQGLLSDESFERKLKIANLVIEKELGFANLISSTSWLEKQSYSVNDYSGLAAQLNDSFAGAPLPLYQLISVNPVSYEQVTQEIRLVSARPGRLNWIAGAYFNDTDQYVGQFMSDPAYAVFINDLFGITPPGDVYNYDQNNNDRQYAVFGELDFSLTDRLHLIAGARFYDLKQQFEQESSGAFAGAPQPLTKAGTDGVNPKVSVKFQASQDAMVYATAAAGFRPGGPNAEIVGPCTLADVYKPSYDNDEVWNYEVGAKFSPPALRGFFNVAVYQIDWKDIQQSVTDPGCGSLFTANVGEARSRGVEAELAFQPSANSMLSGGVSYTDAQFTRINAGFVGATPISAGDRVTDVPRLQANLAGELRFPMTSQVLGYLRADAHHTGSAPGNLTDRSERTLRKSYTLLNAAAGVQFGSFDVALSVRNVTDEVVYVGTEAYGALFGYVLVGQPRTFGLTLRRSFGQ